MMPSVGVGVWIPACAGMTVEVASVQRMDRDVRSPQQVVIPVKTGIQEGFSKHMPWESGFPPARE